jgi:hypothetical protein
MRPPPPNQPFGADPFAAPTYGAPTDGAPTYGAPTYGGSAYGAPGGPGAAGAPPTPPTSRVDTFEDSLVPFLGDPESSKILGRLVQIFSGVLVLYNLVRFGQWLLFASAAQGILNGTGTTTPSQLLQLGQTIDTVALVFWPTLIAVAVIDIVWRRKRRPKEVLAAYGEAYVEATINRTVPVMLRVAMGVSIGLALVTGFVSTSPTNLHPADVPGYATSRAASAVFWALAWLCEIGIVWASERHLARRMAKAADPRLAGYTVPYVQPESDRGAVGETAGVGWILRTAGLVLLLLVSGLLIIGAASELPSGKEPVTDLVFLAICVPIVVLVIRAFVRRVTRKTAATGPAA